LGKIGGIILGKIGGIILGKIGGIILGQNRRNYFGAKQAELF
jgi:hypothetical protein